MLLATPKLMESCWVTESNAVSGAGVFGGKVSEGDAVHGRELGGHGHAEHEQGENEHPQGQGGRLEGELGNHEADADGDAREGHPVAEPVEDLHGESFAVMEPMAVGAIMAPATQRGVPEPDLKHERHEERYAARTEAGYDIPADAHGEGARAENRQPDKRGRDAAGHGGCTVRAGLCR